MPLIREFETDLESGFAAVEGGFADAEREERRRTIITRDKQSFRIRTRKKASSRDSRVYRFRNHFIIIVDINN